MIRVFQRVVDQVDERPRDRLAVHPHEREVRVDALLEREPLLVDLAPIGVQRVGHQLGEVGRAELIPLPASIREKSRMLLISAVSRSLSLRMMP